MLLPRKWTRWSLRSNLVFYDLWFMHHKETSSQSGLFWGFLRALGPRHFWQRKVNCMQQGKSSRAAAKSCHPSSTLNARIIHLELDFQRWGRPAISDENSSRSSQKKQPYYQRPSSSIPRKVQWQDCWRKEEILSLLPPFFSSSAIFHHLLLCYSKTKREPTVTATPRKKHLVLLNKDLLLLK